MSMKRNNVLAAVGSRLLPSAERWTTRDVVFVAAIGAAVGVANVGIGTLYAAVQAAWGPIGGAVINGTYMWGFFLAYYFVRKPGCMLAVGIVEATLGALLGAPSGVYTLGWGVTEGLGAEAVMALAKDRRIRPVVFALAGAGSAQLQTVWSWYVFGWQSTMVMYWISIPITMASGALMSGLLGFYLGRLVHNTGLIHPAEVDQAIREPG